MVKNLCFVCLALLLVGHLKAQDTTWVQAFSFDDIYKRRGEFVLPEVGEYRKILMYYTLKCDPKTPHDKYNCGEWDYLTYNFLYDHNATFDSSYQTAYNFKINGSTPDILKYSTKPLFDLYNNQYEYIERLDTLFYESVSVGTGTDSLGNFIGTGQKSNISQTIWTAAELVGLGLKPGPITGLKFNVLKGAKLEMLRVSLKGTANDSINWENREGDFMTVYKRPTDLNAGWFSAQFLQAFNWNGIDNILVQIETESQKTDQNEVIVEGYSTVKNLSFISKSSEQCLDFNAGKDFVNFGKDVQVYGNEKRTVELWANARTFNGGGLFQAGNTGTTLQDWTLRTMTADNTWRIQLWGQDGDATLDNSKDQWHHYALVHDGTATKLYYDGVFVRQKTVTLNTPNRDFWLGQWSGTYFDGMIDNLRIWETALSEKNLNDWMFKEIDETHTNYDKLRASYNFNNDTSLTAANNISGKYNGLLQGNVWWKKLNALETYKPGADLKQRPNIVFEQGNYNSNIKIVETQTRKMRKPELLFLYQNQAKGRIVKDNSKKHPTKITDTLIVWYADTYEYTYDAKTGKKLDSNYVASNAQISKELKEWYSPTVRYEIGRYITPYGINLSLGPKGFMWVYDVTDYAPLLHDTIDFEAGNLQELIDVKFAFISGKPTHEVKRIDRIWDFGSYSYASLDNDSKLSARKLGVLPTAETFVVRTRLTGHGHNSNDGSFPHCCEWKDNTHYLFVDGKQVADWHIWREDCDLNPVYPQGGNWVGAREGWCPGDLVGDNDINITSSVKGNEVEIDYDITPVPSNNQGMGGGNYIVAMQLFQYGKPSFTTDASIEMVKRPNTAQVYQRINPACERPLITVKNTGSTAITALKITYGVSGGSLETYTWNGKIDFLKSTDIELPIDGSYFWVGDSKQIFTANIIEVNGALDQNTDNNTYKTNFELPEIIKKKPFYVQVMTNNVPEENRYEIRDATGKLVFEKGNLLANTLYRDTVDLPYGCYTLEFFDEGFGLSYWAWPEQGNGTLQIKYADGGIIKNFNGDFGERIYWPFAVGTVSTVLEGEYKPTLSVFPNPSNGTFQIDLNNINEQYTLQVLDITGKTVFTQTSEGNGLNSHKINLNNSKGIYFVKVNTANRIITQKIVVE